MVMATGSTPGNSCLTDKPAPLTPGQTPATTDTMTTAALARHTTKSWSTNDREETNPWDNHRYHGGEPRICSTSR
jgi:hypothetical protein